VTPEPLLDRILLGAARAAACEYEVGKAARWLFDHMARFADVMAPDCRAFYAQSLAHAQGPLARKASRARTRRKAQAVVRQLYSYHWGFSLDLDQALRRLEGHEDEDNDAP
jgi:hypothetical protein